MTFGSLFAGGIDGQGGGFDIGFEQAGMCRLWEVELTRGRDIRQESRETLAPVELICGGPPCQKTSHAAALRRQRSGVSLWPEMLRIVRETLPSWVVVEQPLGGKSVIIQAASELQQLGYGCAGRVIDSRHWLPQTRARWFLVGRMGATGMDVWNRLYPDGERVEGREPRQKTHATCRPKHYAESGMSFLGECPDCMSGGIYSRISSRKSALIAAGNAVSVPVAKWLGQRILAATQEGLD